MPFALHSPAHSPRTVTSFFQTKTDEPQTTQNNILRDFQQLIDEKIVQPLLESEEESFLTAVSEAVHKFIPIRLSLHLLLHHTLTKDPHEWEEQHQELTTRIQHDPTFASTLGPERTAVLLHVLQQIQQVSSLLSSIVEEFDADKISFSDPNEVIEIATCTEFCVYMVLSVGFGQIWMKREQVHDLLHLAYVQSNKYYHLCRKLRRDLVNGMYPPPPIYLHTIQEPPSDASSQEINKEEQEIFDSFAAARRYANQWLDGED